MIGLSSASASSSEESLLELLLSLDDEDESDDDDVDKPLDIAPPAADGARDWSATDTWLEDGCTLCTLAMPGVEPKAALGRCCTLLQLHRLQLRRRQGPA